MIVPFFISLAHALMTTQPGYLSAEDIEQKVMSSRRELRSGVISVEFDSRGAKDHYRGKATTYFSGKLRRRDLVVPYEREDPKSRSYREVICLGETKAVSYSDQVGEGTRTMLTYSDLTQIDPGRFDYGFADPRLIGLAAIEYSNLVHYHLEDLFARSDRTGVKLESSSAGGRDCWKLSYKLHNGTLEEVYIDSDRGWNVVKRVTMDDETDVLVDTIESELAQFGSPPRWFPSKCRYWRSEKGKITNEETLTVKVIQFNQPVDPKLFTLEGMNILAGTMISARPPLGPGQYYWDGRAIKKLPETPGLGFPVAAGAGVFTPQSQVRSWPWLIISFGAAALAAIVFWKLLKPKPAG